MGDKPFFSPATSLHPPPLNTTTSYSPSPTTNLKPLPPQPCLPTKDSLKFPVFPPTSSRPQKQRYQVPHPQLSLPQTHSSEQGSLISENNNPNTLLSQSHLSATDKCAHIATNPPESMLFTSHQPSSPANPAQTLLNLFQFDFEQLENTISTAQHAHTVLLSTSQQYELDLAQALQSNRTLEQELSLSQQVLSVSNEKLRDSTRQVQILEQLVSQRTTQCEQLQLELQNAFAHQHELKLSLLELGEQYSAQKEQFSQQIKSLNSIIHQQKQQIVHANITRQQNEVLKQQNSAFSEKLSQLAQELAQTKQYTQNTMNTQTNEYNYVVKTTQELRTAYGLLEQQFKLQQQEYTGKARDCNAQQQIVSQQKIELVKLRGLCHDLSKQIAAFQRGQHNVGCYCANDDPGQSQTSHQNDPQQIKQLKNVTYNSVSNQSRKNTTHLLKNYQSKTKLADANVFVIDDDDFELNPFADKPQHRAHARLIKTSTSTATTRNTKKKKTIVNDHASSLHFLDSNDCFLDESIIPSLDSLSQVRNYHDNESTDPTSSILNIKPVKFTKPTKKSKDIENDGMNDLKDTDVKASKKRKAPSIRNADDSSSKKQSLSLHDNDQIDPYRGEIIDVDDFATLIGRKETNNIEITEKSKKDGKKQKNHNLNKLAPLSVEELQKPSSREKRRLAIMVESTDEDISNKNCREENHSSKKSCTTTKVTKPIDNTAFDSNFDDNSLPLIPSHTSPNKQTNHASNNSPMRTLSSPINNEPALYHTNITLIDDPNQNSHTITKSADFAPNDPFDLYNDSTRHISKKSRGNRD